MTKQISLFLTMFLLVSCSDFSTGSKLVNVMTLSDTKPPVLLEVKAESQSNVRLIFNEKVRPFADSLNSITATEDENSIVISLGEALTPGKSSTVHARVQDSVGNSTELNVTVWGYNPDIPELQINEFTTKGTQTSPDRIEFIAKTEGNIAGLTIYLGCPENFDSYFVFPEKWVKPQDIVVLYLGTSYPEGTQKPSNCFLSGSSVNPSSNNGVLVLSESPAQGSSIEDAVLYSSFESSKYDGWGTKTAQARAKWVVENSGWTGEAVNSAKSSATRSVCRKIGNKDSNSAEDWYVATTGGATFGSANTSEAYK